MKIAAKLIPAVAVHPAFAFATPLRRPNGLFVEIRLFDDDPQDPWVEIVNAHPQV